MCTCISVHVGVCTCVSVYLKNLCSCIMCVHAISYVQSSLFLFHLADCHFYRVSEGGGGGGRERERETFFQYSPALAMEVRSLPEKIIHYAPCSEVNTSSSWLAGWLLQNVNLSPVVFLHHLTLTLASSNTWSLI